MITGTSGIDATRAISPTRLSGRATLGRGEDSIGREQGHALSGNVVAAAAGQGIRDCR